MRIKQAVYCAMRALCVGAAVLLTAPASAADEVSIDQALQTLLRGVDIRDHMLSRRSDEIKDGLYQVRPGDTLSELISMIYPNSAITHAMLEQAFISANPHAFRSRNPNWLLAGVRLRIPSAEDVLNLVFRDADGVRAAARSDHPTWVRFP
jgi:Tfp pilus assembly protein FimV